MPSCAGPGRMPIVNDRVDTMALAMRYLPDLRRASLDKVASALGLAPRKLHRAEGDAELSARAALGPLPDCGRAWRRFAR